MKDKIQQEKSITKINFLKQHILDLLEYNSINNYDNIKNYTMEINYFYDDIENCYNYSFNITRGLNKSKTLNVRLSYKNKIYDMFDDFIHTLITNEKFKYFAFRNNSNNTKVEKFIINMENDISIEFPINDEEDKIYYQKIYDSISKQVITYNKSEIKMTSILKDYVQLQKAQIILKNVDNVFEGLLELNGLEDYENKKPYKMVIQSVPSLFNKKADFQFYNIRIIRGNNNPNVIMDYNISIKDKQVIYDEIVNLINKYSQHNDFMFPSMRYNNTNGELILHFLNSLEIVFTYNNQEDADFYNNIFSAIQKKEIKNNGYVKKI